MDELNLYYLQKYKDSITKWEKYISDSSKKNNVEEFKKFIFKNELDKIKWERKIFNFGFKLKKINDSKEFRTSFFRPFVKKYLNFNKKLITELYKQHYIFPKENSINKVINITWIGNKSEFDILMTNCISDLHSLIPHSQSFPLYWYDENNENMSSLFSDIKTKSINENIINLFIKKYNDEKITHEDIFHYIYGVFHSEKYKTKYSNNFKTKIPRIPFLEDFWGYSRIGKELGDLHINYEDVDKYEDVKIVINDKLNKTFKELTIDDFRVNEMKLSNDKTSIIFNDKITITNIPVEVHNYKFNSGSILTNIINSYKYSIDKEFKLDDKPIVNDPNEYDPDKGGRYVFDLILSLITVSLKTQELIKKLPKYKEI